MRWCACTASEPPRTSGRRQPAIRCHATPSPPRTAHDAFSSPCARHCVTTPLSCRTTRYFAASSGRSLAAIVAASSPLLHARTDTTLHRTMPARAREDTHDGYRRPCVRRTARHRASGCLRRLPKGIKGDTTVHLRMRVLTTKDFRCALLRTASPLSRRNSLRTYTYPTSLRTTVASRARAFGCLGGALPMHMHEHRRCTSVTHWMNKRDRDCALFTSKNVLAFDARPPEPQWTRRGIAVSCGSPSIGIVPASLSQTRLM